LLFSLDLGPAVLQRLSLNVLAGSNGRLGSYSV
jgi:hypothetical protein